MARYEAFKWYYQSFPKMYNQNMKLFHETCSDKSVEQQFKSMLFSVIIAGQPIERTKSGSSSENLAPGSKDEKEKHDKILHQRVYFQVYYLGVVSQINMTNSKKRDTEPLLIDILEENQIDGKLLVSATDENKVTLFVSRYGIKVMDTGGQEVLQRHPLHTIAQLIQYSDGFNHQNIAVKVGQVGKHVYQCYVFQCHSEDQAQAICNCVRRIFDAITAKS